METESGILSHAITAVVTLVGTVLVFLGTRVKAGGEVQQALIRAGIDLHAAAAAAAEQVRRELASELEAARSTAEDLRRELNAVREERDKLRDDLDERDRYIRRLKSALDNRDSRIETLSSKVDALEQRAARLEDVSEPL